jgi:muramoyltetrapeptide carboxypeptidase
LIDVLEGGRAEAVWSGLDVLRAGGAEGPVVGGNLALVHAMAAARRLAMPPGAILALEDVTERPYRIDRMLTSLRLAGVFARASAVVFGSFAACDPGPDGVTTREVLAELARGLSIPVVANAPFGHSAPNDAFVLGRRVRVEGDSVRFLPLRAGLGR